MFVTGTTNSFVITRSVQAAKPLSKVGPPPVAKTNELTLKDSQPEATNPTSSTFSGGALWCFFGSVVFRFFGCFSVVGFVGFCWFLLTFTFTLSLFDQQTVQNQLSISSKWFVTCPVVDRGCCCIPFIDAVSVLVALPTIYGCVSVLFRVSFCRVKLCCVNVLFVTCL